MTDVINKGLGWRPDVPDIRDEKFAFKRALKEELLTEPELPVRALVDWNYTKNKKKAVHELEVNDQGQTSSCTGQSTGTMIDLISGWTKRSRLELYWFGREAIGETGNDQGAYIRDVIKGAANTGAGSESLWPFAENKVRVQPSKQELLSAGRHKVNTYHRLQTRKDYQSCIAQGFPFVIGFTCYECFVSSTGTAAKHGILNYPSGDLTSYGGHAVCVIGYDNDFRNSEWGKELVAKGIEIPEAVYIVRNSWGSNWGRKGDFAVDCKYFENSNLADDAWTVRIGKNSS